jgi:hypothetical protein
MADRDSRAALDNSALKTTSGSKTLTTIGILCLKRKAVSKIMIERIWSFALHKTGHMCFACFNIGNLKVALHHSSFTIVSME